MPSPSNFSNIKRNFSVKPLSESEIQAALQRGLEEERRQSREGELLVTSGVQQVNSDCLACGKTFKKPAEGYDHVEWCSKECRKILQGPMEVSFTCLVCYGEGKRHVSQPHVKWCKPSCKVEYKKYLKSKPTVPVFSEEEIHAPQPNYDDSLYKAAAQPKRFTPRVTSENLRAVSPSEPIRDEFDVRCPTPLKKAYRTEDEAYLIIDEVYPHDAMIHPYKCRCGGIHIGHSYAKPLRKLKPIFSPHILGEGSDVTKHSLECLVCGNHFEKTISAPSSRKLFCSPECAATGQKRKEELHRYRETLLSKYSKNNTKES